MTAFRSPSTAISQDAHGKSLLSLNAYHYPRGGADVVYLSHAELMARHGWRTHFYAMHHDDNLASDDSAYFAEEINYSKQTSLAKKLVHASRIIYSVEARNKIAQLLDTHHVDIAHVHSIYHHQSPSVLLELKRRGIPIVLTAHDLKLACPSYTMLNSTGVCERCKGGKVWNVAAYRCIKGDLAASALVMIESAVHKALRLYDRTVDRIIAPSDFYRRKLIEWGWDAEKVVHIRNFVDVPAQPPSDAPGAYLLFFGRLSPEKGLITLVRAAARAGVPVRIAGRGPQEAELRALAGSLGAPVEFLGFRRGDDLWATVDRSKAIVLPSEWYENGPMSVIEAFGRRKPLVGAAIGGIPEMIVPGETGWTFVSGDVDALAAALRMAWTTPDAELAAMGQACRKMALSDYSAATYHAQVSALYGELLR